MKILVTRAQPGARQTVAALAAGGAEAIAAPVLEIHPYPERVGATQGAQAIVFTSSAAVRAFAAAPAARAQPAYAVGDATAAAARAAGFADVRSADGDVQKLATLIARECARAAGPLIHFSGADAAGDLAGALAADGFTIERRIIYEAVPVAALPGDILTQLESGAFDAVLFHSPRGAETFCRLAPPAATARLAAACMSPNVARAASVSPWKRMIVAAAPREDALIAAVLAEA